MSEELEQEVQTEQQKASEQTPQQDPIVAKAMEMGWRPQEEWQGDPEDFVDAKEFVQRQPLFDKISGLNKSLKRLEGAFEALKLHHSRVKETEYNRALEQLKLARRQALRDGETEQALALEDKMDEIEAQKKEFEESLPDTPAASNEPHPAFVEWRKSNSWYQQDEAMTAFADELGVSLHKRGFSPEKVMETITKEVRAKFAYKFKNPKREAPSNVESGTRKSGGGSKKLDTSGMPAEHLRIMKTLVASGAISEEEYLEQYGKK